MEYTAFEAVGASDWAWHKGGPVGVKIQNRAAGARFWPTKHRDVHFQAEGTLLGWSTPCLKSWGPAIGHGIRGAWLEPKSQKLSHQGSVFADKIQGGLYFG